MLNSSRDESTDDQSTGTGATDQSFGVQGSGLLPPSMKDQIQGLRQHRAGRNIKYPDANSNISDAQVNNGLLILENYCDDVMLMIMIAMLMRCHDSGKVQMMIWRHGVDVDVDSDSDSDVSDLP